MSDAEHSADDRASLALVLERNLTLVSATLRDQASDAVSPMSALLAARTVADAIEQATQALVSRAREAGHTWQEIGELLSITRQAAQQRFGERPAGQAEAEHTALARRAAEIVTQLDAGDWDAVISDWDEVMRSEMSLKRLTEAWRQILASAGSLEGIGRASVLRKGPYRIADVPLVFTHGPMKARITFNHSGEVSGLFVLLPDAP
jgi:hypothetical protein